MDEHVPGRRPTGADVLRAPDAAAAHAGTVPDPPAVAAAAPPLGESDGKALTPGSTGSAPESAIEGQEVDPARARDSALLARAQAGDLDAFNSLVVLHQDHLVALTIRMVGSREAAEDAVQEAFYSAYRNLHRFRGGSVRAWLTRIAINAATDVLRSRKRKPADPYPELDDETWEPRAGESADPERETIRRAQGRVLDSALRQLTEGQRTAILLFDVEGYDYPEIAVMTGVSLGTVKSRIHRGRLALRELLSSSMELFRS